DNTIDGFCSVDGLDPELALSGEQNPSIVLSQANIRGLFYERLNMEKKQRIHKRSTPDDYNIYGQFELYIVDNVEQLMKKRRPDEQDIKIVLHDEQLFDCINDEHCRIGHGGRTRTLKEIQKKYCNITKQQVETYLSVCEICQRKRDMAKKNIVVKPIRGYQVLSRAQVDLIDFHQSLI
ncbi:unnamed protein product, partial [Didymodactylos carnosus]